MPDYTYINHKVKKGETLWGLSKQYNVEQHKIRQANPEIKITHNGTYEIAHLKIGQIIRIPQEKQIYTNKKTGKKGVKAINGNTLPQAGIKEKYWVTGWYPGTPIEMKNPANVKWAVYYKEKGRYTLKLKKETGEFTFHEQAIGKDIKIVGYLYNPELDNDSALNIKVVTNQTPSITSLILYNIKKDKPLPRNVKLKLGQSIYVVANTTNCVGKKIEFALQKKEEKAGVTNYIPIIQNTEKVSTKGTATTIFKLDDLNLLINSSNTQNYWISAQLEGSENTPYIYENEVEVEKESSKKLPNEEKKKKEDSIIYKGKIAIQEGWNKLKDMYIKKTTSNEPQIQRVSLYTPENRSQVTYKETLKLKIEGIYLKGKSIEYIVYEEDQSQKKELIIDTVQMMGDVQEVDILLTQERFKKGGTNKEELTEGKHEIYVEVKLKEKELVKKTEIIVVDTSTQEIDPIPGNRPVTTGDPEIKKDNKETKCPRCDKDITLEEIKNICVNSKGKCIIKDEKLIKAAIPYLNQYRRKVGINTCIRKAHFLSQIAVESKFYSTEENFDYYWEFLISTFGAFKTEEGKKKAKLWGRAVKDTKSKEYVPVSNVNQINIANWAYKDKNKNGSFSSGDGSTYRGRGFIQITWKNNYEYISNYFNKNMKIGNEANVDWVKNPLDLTNKPKDSIASALAYWGANNINNVAKKNSEECVKSVTRLINSKLEGLNERIKFFKKAVDILKVNECLNGVNKNNNNGKGTIVVVSGKGTKSKESWVVYETNVYKDISLESYKKLKKDSKLPKPNYSTYLARDAHGIKYGRHSDKRYGYRNETPPGEYFLIPGVSGQRYKMYISSNEKSTLINGIHGNRSGIAIHQYNPKFAIGCLTTVTGKDTTIINELLKTLTDLPLKDNKPVRIIIEERPVKEQTWENPKLGTIKWTGIK